jgi:carbonic anhydrase
MDARIDPARALGIVPGDAHVLRNAGGLVTDDVIRSLSISQHALGTREVMVVQHTKCGMHGLDENDLALRIGAASGAPPSANVHFGGFADLDTSVRASVARLRSSALLLHTDRIRGFVYEVETGRVREVV